MADTDRTVDLAAVLDRQRLGRPLLTLILRCAFVTLADGYNISAAGFAAPGVLSARGVPSGKLFLFATVPLAIGAAAASVIALIYRTHFHWKSRSQPRLSCTPS